MAEGAGVTVGMNPFNLSDTVLYTYFKHRIAKVKQTTTNGIDSTWSL